MSGKDREPMPQPAPTPIVDAGLPLQKTTAAPQHNSAQKLDSTRMAALVLRDAAAHVERAVNNISTNRKAVLVAAVGVFGSALRAIEVTDLEQRRVDFFAVMDETRMAAGAATRLVTALHGERLGGIESELDLQLRRFADMVERLTPSDDRHEWTRRHALATEIRKGEVDTPASTYGLSSEEEHERFRQALGGAHQAIAAFRNTPQEDLHNHAAALCLPIPHHLATASDAALSIRNKHKRAKLTPDVEGLSQLLDRVAQLLSMPPTHRWHLVFARMFDGENQLRRSLGLGAKARPYSGTVDPKQAIENIRAVAGGKAPRSTTDGNPVATDPQVAVNTISIGLGGVFDQQARALVNLKSHLQEPPPPKQPSIFDALLDIAASMALAGVAGAIAGAFADRLKKSLESSAKKQASAIARDIARVSDRTTEVGRHALRQSVMERQLKDGAIYRVAAVDGAKDAVKAFVKDGMSLALKSTKSHGGNAAEPRNAYIEHQQAVLRAATHQAALKMAHLAPALAQVDLEILNELSAYINGAIQQEAYDRQYDSSMREWHNFKARLGGHAVDATKRDVQLYSPRIEGVLEARFEIDAHHPTGHASPQSLRLRGGEPASIRHLKKVKRTLDQVGIHTQYVAEFKADRRTSLMLGVGPDLGVQLPGKPDLQLLKLIASNLPVVPILAIGAIAGQYDHVSDAAALQTAKQLVRNMAFISTAWLED